MTATDWLDQLGFLAVVLFTLGCAHGVILARRVLHAALWLLPTLVGVAGAFALMGAHTLFAMQLIVYVGAITVLIVFAVMLLEDEAHERMPLKWKYRIPMRLEGVTNLVLHYQSGMQHILGGLVASGMMFVVIVAALAEAAYFGQWKPLLPEDNSEFKGDNVKLLGELILTRYLLPFEVASVVLLVALIGSVVIARRSPAGTRLVASGTDGADATSRVPTNGGDAR